MIEATNEQELLEILNIISEEAVRLSKKNFNEAGDPYIDKYQSQYSKDESMFGSLSEQDDEDEGAETEDTDDEDITFSDEEVEDDEGEEAEAEDEEEPLEDEPESEEATDFGVSFDSVLSAINNLRAGKSLKDTSIKDQASAYYDRLDDAERKVLLVFLQQFSEILSGALQGSEADDPSDAPYNIIMSVGGEEEGDEGTDFEEEGEEGPEATFTDEEGEAAESFEEPAPEAEEELEPEEEGEDTSPPIRVNEAQDLKQIRRKLRRMMLRG
jgi:hypothetical protein